MEMKPFPVLAFLNGFNDLKRVEQLLKVMNEKDARQQTAMRKLSKKYELQYEVIVI